MTARPPMIKTRPFETEEDWWRVRDLILQTQACTGPGFNFEIRHWEGNRYHSEPEWQPQDYSRFRLYETGDGKLVGMVHYSGDEIICQIHPDYRPFIEEDMLAYGEANYGDTNAEGQRQVCICAFDHDAPRQLLLQKRGYETTGHGWILRKLHFGELPFVGRHSLCEPEMPNGYTLRALQPGSADGMQDCQKLADLLNSAFNRPGFHQASEVYRFSQSPLFRSDLHLVAVAPDGAFASHVGMTLDITNRHGIFEPVCTHPDHRQKSLAQKLMLEGLRRLKILGAASAHVETGDAAPANALYSSIGFTEAYRAKYWGKGIGDRAIRD